MKTDRDEGLRSFRVLIVGLLLVGAAVAAMCIVRVDILRNFMHGETERYLGEVSNHIADQVDQRMTDIFEAMDTAGDLCQRLEGSEERMELLRAAAQSNHMVRMGVAGMDGRITTTDGQSLSADDALVIGRALSGEPASSSVAYSPAEGAQVVIYAVPLRRDGFQVGVLAGSALLDDMRSFLGVESFGGEGYSVIVDRQGDVVTSTESKNAPDEDLNLFLDLELGRVDRGYDIGQVRADMASGGSGILLCAAGRDSQDDGLPATGP